MCEGKAEGKHEGKYDDNDADAGQRRQVIRN